MSGSFFIVYYDLGLGGIQRKIVDIVNFLAKDQPNLWIFILLRRKSKKFNLSQEIKNKKAKIIYYPDWLKIRVPFLFPIFVLKNALRLKPKAILAFSDMPGIVAVWIKLLFFWRKTKVVISEDRNFLPSAEVSEYKCSWIRHLLVKIFYPFADTVFCVNKPFATDLLKNYHLSSFKIKLIRNWTYLTEKRIPSTSKKYDFIYVGRFAKVKNLKFLLKGVKELKRFIPNFKLCLIGEGEEEDDLRFWRDKNNLQKNIIIMGPKTKVEDYIAQAKVFILASKSEGLPISALEAMALEVPVLASDYPGVKELIKDGETGFIYKYNNMREFINKSLKILADHDKLKKVGQQARAYVRRFHSPKNIKDYLKALGIE